MDTKELHVNGESFVIKTKQKFTVKKTLNFGMNRTFEPGDTIVLKDIRPSGNDGDFIFSKLSDPEREEVIVKYAIENLLEDDHLTVTTE